MAANNCYLGQDGKARKTKKIYVGVDNKARICQYAYVGVNGVAKRVYAYQIPIPSVSGDYTYNGEEQSVVINYLDKEFVNISGTTKATNAGNYSFTCSLKDPLTEWEDGTTADKTYSWSIGKAAATIIVEKTAVTRPNTDHIIYEHPDYYYECKVRLDNTGKILYPAFSVSGEIQDYGNYTVLTVEQNKFTFRAYENPPFFPAYDATATATFTLADTSNYILTPLTVNGTNYILYDEGYRQDDGDIGQWIHQLYAYAANLTI